MLATLMAIIIAPVSPTFNPDSRTVTMVKRINPEKTKNGVLDELVCSCVFMVSTPYATR